MVFARTVGILDYWRNKSASSRYYEQSALEDVARAHPHFVLPPQADVCGLYLLPSHSYNAKDRRGDMTLGGPGNATALWMGLPLLSVHVHVIPGENYARWARSAAVHVVATLLRTPAREDLCAVHAKWCEERR